MNVQPSGSLSSAFTKLNGNGNGNGNGNDSVSLTNNLPTEIFRQLYNNDTEEKILQAGVKIIYQALKCDRVVVYSMEAESMCRITAEAVTAGYARILNRIFRDVCFEEGYIEKYQKGRVRAISDVDNSTVTPCHLDTLREIDVKANLVVPLINRDTSLYGLLVMHQCSSSRQWQQTEVEFVLEIAEYVIAQITQLRTNNELATQLANCKQAAEMIGGVVKEIHAGETAEEVLQISVDKAKEIINCDRIVVYSLQHRNMGEIVAEATAPALASILGNVIKDPCFEYRYIDQYEQGRIRSIPNIYEAGMTACYVDNLAKIGVRSNLVAPILWDDGKIYGLLVAHQCFDFKDWQESEIDYFKEIAFHTGLSLSKAKVKERFQLAQIEFDSLNSIGKQIAASIARLQEIKQPILQSGKILIEVNNLNKLLAREITLVNQNGSPQTRKDTKMMQIMIRKLAIITDKLRQSLYSINDGKNEVNVMLAQISDTLKNNQEE